MQVPFKSVLHDEALQASDRHGPFETGCFSLRAISRLAARDPAG